MEKKNIEIYILDKSEYDKLKVLEGNRTVETRRLNLTIKSIKAIGMIGEVFASEELFLKTGLYYIIDGQSRVSALINLGMNIPIRLIAGDPYKLLTSLNRNQRQFSIIDFVNVNVYRNDPFSRSVKEIMNRYNVLPTVAFHACLGYGVNSGFNKKVVSCEDIPIWGFRFDFMDLLSSLAIPFKYEMPFVRAYLKAYKSLDRKRIIKLNKNILIIKKGYIERDYLIAFENIINRNSPQKVFLSTIK